jgi:hypothetical protein
MGAVPAGCTPGKLLMSIRVIHVDDVQSRNAAETLAYGVRDRVDFWP